MKVYKIKYYSYKISTLYIKEFPEGKEIIDFKSYFPDDKDISSLGFFNKKDLEIYTEYSDGATRICLYNKEGDRIYEKWSDEEAQYPKGELYYRKYVNKLRKEKLEKILNKGKNK